MDVLAWTVAGIFALLSVYFSFREDKRKNQLKKQEKELQRKLYEAHLLNQITEKIGYSLNIETISETIALSVQNLFELSTVSYAIHEADSILIKTFKKENVPEDFCQKVSETIINAMSQIDPLIKSLGVENKIASFTERDSSLRFDANQNLLPQSYFNIPLVVDNRFVGMINISSAKKGIYQDADMSLLYKIVNSAEQAIGRLHEVLETEKAKLNSLILSLPSGTILFELKKGSFDLSVINQAAKTFLKIEEEPGVARVLSRFGPELPITDHIKDVIRDKKSIILRKSKIFDKTFTIYITPVFMHNTSDIIGVSIILRDMTLEEKIERIRADFTNMLVHELRAPVSAIKGASNLLMSQALEKREEDKMLNVISESATDMLATISELLDVARIEEGKFLIHKTRANIEKIISEHVDVFSYAAREKGIVINFTPLGLEEFFFDPVRTGQIINNLVSNSIKFGRESGRLDIKIAQKPGEIEVLVADNGIGIPESRMPFLFTKFGQIYPDKSRESSGLGLYITKEIVEAHGGKIRIESKEGLGTQAYFTLPFIQKPQEDQEVIRNFAN